MLRPTVIALALLYAAFALTAAAPEVEARGFCANTVDDWCPGTVCVLQDGNWRCTEDIIVCIREPCPIGP